MCGECGFEELIEQIDEMLDGEDFEWAEDTLTGIREWCAEHEHCTENQKDAVDNIESKRR